MKHTTTFESKFNFVVDTNKKGESFITIYKDEDDQKITFNYWEAYLLLKKLKLEFSEK